MVASKIRKDFPLINRPGFVYLDSGATAHKPQAVIDAIATFYQKSYATVHRGLYPAGETSTANYEQVRQQVAQFINTAHASEIVFTRGTTESINLVASTWALEQLRPGDEIVLTQAEHHANLLPWQHVASKTGAKLVFIPIDPTTYQVSNPISYLTPKTRLVAVTHTSNVLGDIWPPETLQAFIQQSRKHNATILIDAAQAIAHEPIDVQALDCDFLAFSGHKLFGPTGVGVLYANRRIHHQLTPYHRGGSMVHDVTFADAQWAAMPQLLEAGTPPIAQVIGLGAALTYITTTFDWPAIKQHEAALCQQLLTGLNTLPGITIIGNQEIIKTSGHLVSFAISGIHAHDIAGVLGAQNIAVRAGSHCAQPLINALGHSALLRVSVAAYNSPEDITHFLAALTTAVTMFTTTLARP